jgi:peptidoglycan/LPS O-acetylase OafA/YrhL
VVQLHFLRFVGLDTPLHQISSITSEYAVIVFFILSGYLITHSLEMNIERNVKLRLDIYLVARIARLYPPLLYAIGVSATVFLAMDVFGLPGRNGALILPGDLYAAREVVHLSLGEIKNALFLLQGMLEINGPLWSLYIEAKLYILFACLLVLITEGSIVRKLVCALVFYFVAKAGLSLNPGFATYAAIWLIGALAYYVWNERGSRWNRIGICVALIAAAEFWVVLKDEVQPLIVASQAIIAVLIAWLMFKLRLRVPASQRLSDSSYSLYATHFPVIMLAQSLLISTGSDSVIAAIAVAILSIAAAAGVALIGGAIEAKKTALQSNLLAILEHLRRSWSKPS